MLVLYTAVIKNCFAFVFKFLLHVHYFVCVCMSTCIEVRTQLLGGASDNDFFILLLCICSVSAKNRFT